MKTIVITGASGFIGQYCINHLKKSNYNIHAIYHDKPGVEQECVTWHRVNLFHSDEIEKLISNVLPEEIIHLAWYVEHTKFWTSEINHYWVKASLSLLNIAEKYNVRRIMGVGSCAEYDWSHSICEEYVTPIIPKTLYGQCKAATESMFKAYLRRGNIETVWARIFFIFGPKENKYKLVSSVIGKLLNNEKAVCQHSQYQRDYLYIDDVASALIDILKSDVNGAINVGSGTPVKLGDIFSITADIMGESNMIVLQNQVSTDKEPKVIYSKIERLNNEVGWEQRYTLEQGIKSTVKYWQSINNF